jgi:hypothetical protein
MKNKMMIVRKNSTTRIQNLTNKPSVKNYMFQGKGKDIPVTGHGGP